MKPSYLQLFALMAGLLTVLNAKAATDSYRFLHVTIETPWAIFLFLLVFIMIPFILMAMLYWHFAFKKSREGTGSSAEPPQAPVEKQVD